MTTDNAWLKPLQLGWVIALSLTLGVIAGRWVDTHYHLTPFGTVSGVLLAFVICAYQVYRVVVALDKEEMSKKSDKKPQK